ncbi:hypothetical protein RFI_24819 [Reticulomyxa filosa]|uniref:Uncharacterized protein n=1 Tax=Reticulomyxa filosa TaxID=46433 RepID=X6MFU8_RETFI|nr:hypothetical protein RFI_24819 [Reticulomyxa filosa]|eukprot:ETO12556.1 hypothetical protein RFI_24819 [Reticulomyxa filosa]
MYERLDFLLVHCFILRNMPTCFCMQRMDASKVSHLLSYFCPNSYVFVYIRTYSKRKILHQCEGKKQQKKQQQHAQNHKAQMTINKKREIIHWIRRSNHSNETNAKQTFPWLFSCRKITTTTTKLPTKIPHISMHPFQQKTMSKHVNSQLNDVFFYLYFVALKYREGRREKKKSQKQANNQQQQQKKKTNKLKKKKKK